MEVKPGYKQTEVGVIPEEWDVSTVGREFELKLGKMLDAERNIGVPKPYLGNKAVQWDRIDITDLPTVPMSRADIEKYRLCEGDLLVCEGGEVGRAAIWKAPIPECYYQKALHRLRPLRGFNSQVMVALLRQWSDRGVLKNYVTQTSIAHLPREKFMEVPLPVPPAPEQLAIATALSDMDALLGAMDHLIVKKRDLKQAAMQKLLTGQTRLPGFHGEWKLKLLGEVTTLIPGGVYGEEKQLDSLIPSRVATTAHIEMNDTWNNKEMNVRFFSREQVDRYSPIEGDLIVVKSSGSAASIQSGKIGFVDENQVGQFVFSNFLMLLRPAGILPKFLYFYLCSNNVKKLLPTLVEASTYPNIRIPEYLALEIPFPPLKEQNAIAAVLMDMDAELAALEQRRGKTRSLKQGMMQELLTGRTRLI
jgi:type I restriction enzyme S subunit